jgi:hypothetical protein
MELILWDVDVCLLFYMDCYVNSHYIMTISILMIMPLFSEHSPIPLLRIPKFISNTQIIWIWFHFFSFSLVSPASFLAKCFKKACTAFSMFLICSASSLGISTPISSSIATISSTASNESKPNYSKVAVFDSLSCLHFGEFLRTCMILDSTS